MNGQLQMNTYICMHVHVYVSIRTTLHCDMHLLEGIFFMAINPPKDLFFDRSRALSFNLDQRRAIRAGAAFHAFGY